MNVVVDSLVRFPKSALGSSDMARMLRRCTYRTMKGGYGASKPEEVIIRNYDENSTHVSLPYTYGLAWVSHFKETTSGVTIKNCTLCKSAIYPKCPDPHHPLAPANQKEFFADTLETVRNRKCTMVVAPTGCGKTVCALYVAYHLQQTMLVIVPNEALVKHWRDEVIAFLGLDDSQISLVSSKHKPKKGALVTIAVINSLVSESGNHDYVFEGAGLTIFDESHRLGAATFSLAMKKVKSTYRLGCTATPTRKDGMMPMVLDTFGPITVQGKVEALPCTYTPIRYAHSRTAATALSGMNLSRAITRLAADEHRNRFIVNRLLDEMDNGDCALVVSDRVAQLQSIRSLILQSKRFTADQIGFFADSAIVNGKKVNISLEHHEQVIKDPSILIVLSTYSRIKEGVNIPRLSVGIDATPRADGEQLIGRIRRPMKNKLQTRWLTIIDKGVSIFEAIATKRMRDFRNAGATETILAL